MAYLRNTWTSKSAQNNVQKIESMGSIGPSFVVGILDPSWFPAGAS